LGKDVEQFRLFYCEDLFSPEEAGHYEVLRQQCTTPFAIGELWNDPHEWRPNSPAHPERQYPPGHGLTAAPGAPDCSGGPTFQLPFQPTARCQMARSGAHSHVASATVSQ